MGAAGEPVATGLVASLARPGGKVTGMAMMSAQMSGKRLELLYLYTCPARARRPVGLTAG